MLAIPPSLADQPTREQKAMCWVIESTQLLEPLLAIMIGLSFHAVMTRLFAREAGRSKEAAIDQDH